ncbi:MAG: hypothetical protein ACTSRS_19250 [Candidatus Helarchaeota archaeon]
MRQIWKLAPFLFLLIVFLNFSSIPVFSNNRNLLPTLSLSVNYLINTQREDGAFAPSDMNLSSLNTYIFIHSSILDSLMDARSASCSIPQDIIFKAQNYSLRIKYKNSWNFSALVATDSDMTAAATIALYHSGVNSNLLKDIISTLSSTITDEGYSKAWISANDTMLIYFVRNATYSSYFGDVYDSIYLTAGTIYSLFWICKYWYLGQYYGTFLCTRVIASVKPEAPSLANAYTFLMNSQLADGGWGRNATSNPLDTALALISLHYLKLVGYECDNILRKGLNYLIELQTENGAFPQVPLWTAVPNVYYQGKSLTTAFAAKALSLYLSTSLTNDSLKLFSELILIIIIIFILLFALYYHSIKKGALSNNRKKHSYDQTKLG